MRYNNTMSSKSRNRPRVLSAPDAIRLGILSPKPAVRVIDESILEPSLGKSLVALRDISAGQVVCTYGGRVISSEECLALESAHSNPFCARICYMMCIDDADWVLDGYPHTARNRTNLGSFINDCRGIERARVNVQFEQVWLDDQRLLIVAETVESIAKGKELWVSYGPKWWNFDRQATKQPCSCLHTN